jgi:DNA (cytosine-5)-methyltransferase 1
MAQGRVEEGGMRLLDLFCCAGGAGMGYHQAGFEVVGVDINPQPRYPFEFHQSDALEYAREHGHEFDAIHASPPCQDHMRNASSLHGTGWLLPATRELLNQIGKPYIIENVPGADMRADFSIQGAMVGLPMIKRERWFEVNWEPGYLLPFPDNSNKKICVVGTGTPTGSLKTWGRTISTRECRDAMGIGWMNRKELSQAIPPAYTKFIGEQLLEQIRRAA